MLTIYALAALPFFTGGLVITLAISRLASRINAVYAVGPARRRAGLPRPDPAARSRRRPRRRADRRRARAGRRRALRPARRSRPRFAGAGAGIMVVALAGQLSGVAVFDVVDTKGHQGDRVLFSKWNSFSRIGVYERTHGDWSLSPTYKGALPDTRYMDIDSAASTPILHVEPGLGERAVPALRADALAYQLRKPPGFSALVIGPGGGRDLVSALVFGAGRVDGVEINPIIANDVMRGQFGEFSGGIYTQPRVRIAIDDGRSFVRRSPDQYDVIQASLVDTWAATAAGAYTLTENTLYTVEAFNDYLDHLTDDGDRDDDAVGVRRPAPGVARAGGVRIARLGREVAPRHRAVRPGADVPAEAQPVHATRKSPRSGRRPIAWASPSSTLRWRPARRHVPCRASGWTAWRRPTTRGSSSPPTGRSSTTTTRTTSARPPTIARSSFTRRSSRISSRSRSASRCSSATA